MDLTIGICTWNRCDLLQQTLTALTQVETPGNTSWEIVVANNNCTDDTDDIVRSFQDTLPIRVLYQPRQGKAHAANSIIAEARGRLLVWLDDDVIPAPRWLCAYAEAERCWPDHAVYGGPIVPLFEGRPPTWLLNGFFQVSTVYGFRESSPLRTRIEPDYLPFGANYAVRIDVQRQFLFDPTKGVKGTVRQAGGYETSVLRDIVTSGHLGRWLPEASVSHFVRKATQSVSFLRKYYRAQGMAAPLEGTDTCPKLFGCPRWLFSTVALAELQYCVTRVCCPPTTWLSYLKRASVLRGQLDAAINHQR